MYEVNKMTTEIINEKINSIIDDDKYGLEVYALLCNDCFQIKKFQINSELENLLKDKVKQLLLSCYLSDEFILDSINNISDNKKVFYEIEQNADYSPFSFLNTNVSQLEKYSEKEQSRLKGFFLRINRNDSYIWIYQHKYPVTLINRSTTLLARLNGSVYEPLNCDVVKFDSKIDFIIVGNSIITKNISLLQNVFGFETYIRSESDKVIDTIRNLNFISDITALTNLNNQSKLTTAKKLIKLKNSPVLNIPKKDLYIKIKEHEIYSQLIKFDEEGNKIVISSKKSVNDLLKLLNDEYLISRLTGTSYESTSKNVVNVSEMK